jgi:putative glutamine amidotransferase
VALAPYKLARGRVSGWDDGAQAVPSQYVEALARSGLSAAIVTSAARESALELVERCDGALLVGGGDVDPSLYGATPHPATYGVDGERDRLEMALVGRALARGMPVLAICRGLQVLNVSLGGTLHQHLADLPGTDMHGVPGDHDGGAVHGVRVAPRSRLAFVTDGADELAGCVSVHHQAVDRVGAGLVVTGWSADGVIEALETSPAEGGRQGWVLAVQWHPERSAPTDARHQAVFDAFAEAVLGAPGPRA